MSNVKDAAKGLGGFAFGRKILSKVAGTDTDSSTGPKNKYDSAALVKRNEDYAARRKTAGTKALPKTSATKGGKR